MKYSFVQAPNTYYSGLTQEVPLFFIRTYGRIPFNKFVIEFYCPSKALLLTRLGHKKKTVE